jgi:hypothetical protein
MQVRVPVIVKDPVVPQYKDVQPTEEITIEDGAFLDGPVSPRVAVLDFEPGKGTLAPPARSLAPKGRSKRGTYDVAHPVSIGAPDVDPIAATVSVFGAVHKTIALFEEPDALGRAVDWAFDAPQLLVVPRAGEMAKRESHSVYRSLILADTSGVPRASGMGCAEVLSVGAVGWPLSHTDAWRAG